MKKHLFVSSLLLFLHAPILCAQTKTYATLGLHNYFYKTKDEALTVGDIKTIFYGVDIDRYINYHYAITTGATYLHTGYDNGPSKWDNRFIQVPLGIKAASQGEILGLSAGINLNYLLKSTLRETADTLGNEIKTDVTKAFHKVQPDLFFAIIIRLKRFTVNMKPVFSLSNRYSEKVKGITDKNTAYYGSWYAYILAEDDHKLKASGMFVSLSVRLF